MTAYSKQTNVWPGRAATVYQTADAIIPTDGNKIGPYSAIYVGVTGDVTVVMRNDDGTHPVTFKGVPAGTILPIGIQGVNATDTTATDIVGLA